MFKYRLLPIAWAGIEYAMNLRNIYLCPPSLRKKHLPLASIDSILGKVERCYNVLKHVSYFYFYYLYEVKVKFIYKTHLKTTHVDQSDVQFNNNKIINQIENSNKTLN